MLCRVQKKGGNGGEDSGQKRRERGCERVSVWGRGLEEWGGAKSCEITFERCARQEDRKSMEKLDERVVHQVHAPPPDPD